MSTAPQVIWDKAPQVQWDKPAPMKDQSHKTQFEQKNELSPNTRQANEFLLGTASGASGLPETMHPLKDAAKGIAAPPDLKDPGTYLGPAYGIAKGIYNTGKEIFSPKGENESQEDADARRAHGIGSGVGMIAPAMVGEGVAEHAGPAIESAKGAIGDAARTPYGNSTGASGLKPGVKAVSSIAKYFGGPELADWMIPERSSGPTGPYSKVPNRLTAAQQEKISPGIPQGNETPFGRSFEPGGKIVEPTSKIPDVNRELTNYPRESLFEMAKKGDTAAIAELRRNPARWGLPTNSKYLIEK